MELRQLRLFVLVAEAPHFSRAAERVHVGEPRVEHALLAVLAGAGPPILPESVSERYATPGVRSVPLADPRASFQTVALTPADHANLATPRCCGP